MIVTSARAHWHDPAHQGMNQVGRMKVLSVWQLVLLVTLTTLGCGGGDGADGVDDDEPAIPTDVSMLDTPGMVVSPGTSSPEGFAFDTSAFRVSRDLTLLMSISYQPGDLLLGTDQLTQERREAIVAFDYGRGIARELYVAPTEDTFAASLPILLDGRQFYTSLTSLVDSETRIVELDVESGATLTQSVVPSPWGQCQAVANGDYYFDWLDEFLVARDVTTSGTVAGVTAVASAADFCPSAGFGSLDGNLVVLDAPTEERPGADTIDLWVVESGARQSPPLVSVAVNDVTLGTEGERAPKVAIADDGLYVLSSDFVSIAIWFVPYARRPGAPAGDYSPQPPSLVTRIEIP
ncbi:MAG: hypothetical protein AAF436_14390, partial [Myxococcota bacterium]